jgi:hypothetical protein
MTESTDLSREIDRVAQIRNRIATIRRALTCESATEASSNYAECAEAIQRIEGKLSEFENRLDDIPPIDVVVLGPSRHGKSTLLNSLVQTELLPTSDVKPCTASILTLNYAEEWTVHLKFVNREHLLSDWREAVRDAQEALSLQSGGEDEVTTDEPRFIKSVLQRFIQLFRIDPDLPPDQLLTAVKDAGIPAEHAKWLGRTTKVRAENIEGMRAAVARYLSTKDVFWTIVERCDIYGPFPAWHPSLKLVDLPGTNDTDPQRTLITNSLRESATAVAIVTSDSNIGPDVESWLRNSSVLANFLEATDKRRQRLFIIRTKLDSYHPNIDSSMLKDLSEEEENLVHRRAVDAYKTEQTSTFLAMLRDIAGPKLPSGMDEESRRRRADLLTKIDEIQVFFVSALAHEVFSQRYSTSRKAQRQLSEYFDDDIEATGVPDLRRFLIDVASTYLSENFYDDLESAIESEVRLLASSFQKIRAATRAELVGGRQTLQAIVTTVRDDLIPWLKSEVSRRSEQFQLQTLSGANGISHRLKQVEAMSERRFEDKITIWTTLHWASLRSVARKSGVHVTSRGRSIDINEDICSVLVDDVLLAWTHFRDHLIAEQITNITDGLASEVQRRLQDLQQGHGIPEVAEAVMQISSQLMGITNQQRLELLTQVNEKISQVESIRRPAYRIAQEEMSEIFNGISYESGAGCSYRMQQKLRQGAPAAIQRIRTRVTSLIADVVNDLSRTCTSAITTFGTTASDRISTAISHVSSSLTERDTSVLQERVRVIDEALKRLPGPGAK